MEVGDFGQRLTLLVSRDAKLAWSKVTACHEDTKTNTCFLQTSGWSTVLLVHITYVRHKPTVFTYAIHG